MLWVLIRIASASDSNEYPQHMFLWRNKQNYPLVITKWATTWQNQQNKCAPSEDSISLGILPVWSESSLCAQWVAENPMFLHADSEDADQTRPDLSLRWAHSHFVGLSCRGSDTHLICSTVLYSAKEKQDVTNLLRGSIKEMFTDQTAYAKKMTKEQVWLRHHMAALVYWGRGCEQIRWVFGDN